jgi:predicted RecA/RadA family phage recombinase
MSQATYLGPDDEFEGVAAADLVSGNVVINVDGRHGVITSLAGFRTGQRFRAQMRGRFRIDALSTDTFAANAVVFWDAVNRRCTSTAGANTRIGRAAAAKTSGQTSVEVFLNGLGPTV